MYITLVKVCFCFAAVEIPDNIPLLLLAMQNKQCLFSTVSCLISKTKTILRWFNFKANFEFMSLLKEILRGIKLNLKLNMPMLEYFAQCVLIRKTSSPQKGKHQIP